MASAVAAVVDALVTTITALPAMSGVAVLDGPPVRAPGDADLVIVGHNGDPDTAAEVTVSQTWADLACTRRYESGDVPCCVVSQTGDTDLSARRLRAFALLSAIETALRSDLTLAGAVMSAQLATDAARQSQNGAGSAVVVPFTVTYFAQV